MSRVLPAAQKIGSLRKVVLYTFLALLSLVLQGYGGPQLAALGGEIPMAFATIFAGVLYVGFALLLRKESLKGKGRRFWAAITILGVASACITMAYANAAQSLPVGTLTPVMGLGILPLIIYPGWVASRGWRRGLTMVSPLLTLAGFAIFLSFPGKGYIDGKGMAFAIVAAVSLGTFTYFVQRTSKDSHAIAAISTLLSGILLLAGSFVEALLGTGHLPSGEWMNPEMMLEFAALGIVWMLGPTVLNKLAASNLPDGFYPALQPLGSPISLFMQFFVMHQVAAIWSIAANTAICAGSIVAPIMTGDAKARAAKAKAEPEAEAMAKIKAEAAESLSNAVRKAVEDARNRAFEDELARLLASGLVNRLAESEVNALRPEIQEYALELVGSTVHDACETAVRDMIKKNVRGIEAAE